MILLLAVAGLLGLTFNYYGPGIICGKDYYSSNLPRDSPVLLPNGSALFPMQECQGYQLEEANIDDLQALLSSRALRSVDLVHCYESRIHQTSNYLGYAMSLLIVSEFRLTAGKCRNTAQSGCLGDRQKT